MRITPLGFPVVPEVSVRGKQEVSSRSADASRQNVSKETQQLTRKSRHRLRSRRDRSNEVILSHLLQLVPISNPDTTLLRPKSSELSLGSLESLVTDDGFDGGDFGEELEHGGEMGEGGKDDGEGGVVCTAKREKKEEGGGAKGV